MILDDATSEIYYAQLVEEESTSTVMAGLREVIESKGVFCALYSDRGATFSIHRMRAEKWTRGGRRRSIGALMAALDRDLPVYYVEARGYEVDWKTAGKVDLNASSIRPVWLAGSVYQ